jgi:hypothetical protein
LIVMPRPGASGTREPSGRTFRVGGDTLTPITTGVVSIGPAQTIDVLLEVACDTITPPRSPVRAAPSSEPFVVGAAPKHCVSSV